MVRFPCIAGSPSGAGATVMGALGGEGHLYKLNLEYQDFDTLEFNKREVRRKLRFIESNI